MDYKKLFEVKQTGFSFDYYNGKLFCLIEDAFTALDIQTGEVVSCYKKGNAVSLCVIDGHVVTQDMQGQKTLVLDPATLSVLHEIPALIDVNPSLKRTHFTTQSIFPLCVIGNTTYRARVSRQDLQINEKRPATIGLNGIHQVLDDENFLSKKDPLLSCHKFESGELVWECDFGAILPNGRVTLDPTIVESQGLLYVYAFDADGSALQTTFCLDGSTGAILLRFDGFPGSLTHAGSKIISANWHMLHELSLHDYSISTYDLQSELKPYNLKICYGRTLAKGSLLYFISGAGMPTNWIGVVSLESNKLVGAIECGVQGTWIRSMDVFGDKLVVHRSDNTLQVIEISSL